MTPEQKEQLEEEQRIGIEAQLAFDGYIQKFCADKRMSLFMAFSELPLTAEDALMEVKRMLYAIDTLEAEIISKIDTGKMASTSLEHTHEVH